MSADIDLVIRTARTLLEMGWPVEQVVANPLIPEAMREAVKATLAAEQTRILSPARVVSSDPARRDWVRDLDRSQWHYWPSLRQYLLSIKGWDGLAVRSLDDSSDSILRQLSPPTTDAFDTRGLVLGYVQSGKTASFTALIAKAADAGYRLFIVLSGIDNSLRRQTQIRLDKELVGYPDGRHGAVALPPIGRQWHQLTSEDVNGDFRAGHMNHGPLQGTQPVLLVVKKNGTVLRRLLTWLHAAPDEVRATLPLLVIDDEADQASVDVRGSYQVETDDENDEEQYVEPSVINSRIRSLMGRFRRSAYVAYTATPFANILIPHDTYDPTVGSDLYPKDFIVALPRPIGYFGAEEIFGSFDPVEGERVGGLDIIRHVPDVDQLAIDAGSLPNSLEVALTDFVLTGAARAQRGQSAKPATMLVHTSQRIDEHSIIKSLLEAKFVEIRDEWRYQRGHGIRERLSARWDEEFRPITRQSFLDRDVSFVAIEPHVGPFFESLTIKEINSATGDVLDYDGEPGLKAVAVGGNRLSRGLTLEGLTVSYFLRAASMYDTLMQMGRWFGFRPGYEDLTRIWMTPELAGWFADLAFVESQLRDDIEVYETQGLTPHEVGMRIWQHPTMQVTSPLKQRFASETTIAQSYSFALQQTFKYPFSRPGDLAIQEDNNQSTVRTFVGSLGEVAEGNANGPVWKKVQPQPILDFLDHFRVDPATRSISIELVHAYIRRMNELGELVRWVVAIQGREKIDNELGQADWHSPLGPINQVSRSRIKDSESVGVITSPGDEAAGLDPEAIGRMKALIDSGTKANHAARSVRSPEEGLLLLYPISRSSGYDIEPGGIRKKIFDDPKESLSRDLVGLAISFPKATHPQRVDAYLEGTVGWRPVE